MMDYIRNFEWNGWLGICLYWLPLAFCVYGYSVETWIDFRKDIRMRAAAIDPGYYQPGLTVGTLISHVIMTVVPIVNLFAAIFDLAPDVFGRFISLVEKVFDQPLVPRRKRLPE